MQELFLDIETSGTDPIKHSILSIGIVISLNGLEDYQSFYREIKYNELLIMPSAIEVNGFDFTSQSNRISLLKTDEEAVSFIKKYYKSDIKPIPIGLNIAGFDMQFIHRWMPLLSNRLSGKSIELNSFMYLLAEKHSKKFKELKEELTKEADNRTKALALGVEKHHALFDAVFNLNLYLMIKKDLLSLEKI
ncbi:MAG: hypothetical protein A2287_07505 [Candidatus Melainabacteria bacterium RIFOXYA12_FULL_32_12]|nr:MAG: hypothetical protein A2104_06215 [Candidatus Melainabacteria bacterium GWF2_32_7]OGI17474.1 MAG: hypothetical protein A2255_08405 [Candidatus Melainabacteria bacterium RIFOXYA2_FULL_32_9]OGI29097.1 MAG: hypothetical protein A2287_07505 [Candidatus Melainabacteria bacterium RIFOXYA12_FULL_32_12]